MTNRLQELIETPSKPSRGSRSRFSLMWLALWISGAALFGRSFYLQVINGRDFLEAAEKNRVGVNVIPAPRGIIYDRNHTPLTENVSSTDLIIDPTLLPVQDNESYLIDNLVVLLPDIPAAQIQQAIMKARDTQRPVILAKALPHETVLKLEAEAETITGTRLSSSLVRKYPFGESAAHVLGYASGVTAQDLEENGELYPTDIIGKTGIEKVYDDLLRGRPGHSYSEVNAAGRPQTDLGTLQPEAGQDIQLTLDIRLQQFIYGLFSETDSKRRQAGKQPLSGAIVVTNPQSGEVLAMVSYPAFNANAFSQPSLSSESSKYFDDKQQPMFNRAADGTYPSGSIIKPFIAAAALQEKIITPSTTVLSTGGITIGPWHFLDWKPGGHGTTDVKKAIAESVNTFFYLITGGDDQRRGLGVDAVNKYLRAFGWAQKTAIDLSSEASGFLPTPQWKEEYKHEKWYIGDTYHLGIGQGDVLVTPLQVAVSTGSIANGKHLYQPFFVDGRTDRKTLPISSDNIAVVRDGMRQAVTEGSARSLSVLPIPLAGKTGTAQIGNSEDTHAWFTSYGPADNPDKVVTVLLERGGSGDEDAVPLAKEIWQWLIDNQHNT